MDEKLQQKLAEQQVATEGAGHGCEDIMKKRTYLRVINVS